MKYIVTGGAGFIGHNVVRQLEAEGNECFVLDSNTNYGFVHKAELEYLTQERKRRMRAGVHYVDLRDHKQVEDFVRTFSMNCDAIIHLASFPRQKVVERNPIWAADVMGTGLVHLLELTKNYKIPKFIYVSSSMVYGDFHDRVREGDPCRPIGQYGIMKLMGEDLVKDYARRNAFDHVIVRPSAVYGEYDVDDRVISKFMLAALQGATIKVNGATECLDFTHVEDTAQGIVLAATNPSAVGKVYNITRNAAKPVTLLDAAALCIKITGKGKIDIQDRDMSFPTRGRLSNERARMDLGFNPTIDVKEGFERYCNWFLESRYWQTKL